MSDLDVVLIGAGMAGLAAACALAERGLRVVVLEARDRVGGRVFSETRESGAVVEYGAEFVHGRAPELWALIDECGAKAVERDGTMLREVDGVGLQEDEFEDDAFSSLDELEGWQKEDVGFAEWLETSDVPLDERPAILGYVEGFNAADARRIGVKSLGVQQAAEDEIEGDRAWHVHGGYQALPEYLHGKLKDLGGVVLFGEAVQSVTWSEGSVEIRAEGKTFNAAKCIVTLPLGVLQAGDVEFIPRPAALEHVRRLAMGNALRFTLVFRERWWERSTAISQKALREMSFLFTPQRMPPVWWTARPETENVATLVGWVGGPRADALAGKSAQELADDACRDLAEVFRVDESVVRAALLEVRVHDWASDPYARGAYSYVLVGGIDASAKMCVPEKNTLFFAGEHTDVTGNWGTVHAALGSGLRAARQILGAQ